VAPPSELKYMMRLRQDILFLSVANPFVKLDNLESVTNTTTCC